jgi:hypothetical protein
MDIKYLTFLCFIMGLSLTFGIHCLVGSIKSKDRFMVGINMFTSTLMFTTFFLTLLSLFLIEK